MCNRPIAAWGVVSCGFVRLLGIIIVARALRTKRAGSRRELDLRESCKLLHVVGRALIGVRVALLSARVLRALHK